MVPQQRPFSRLSKFFLMHFCDQFVYEEHVRELTTRPNDKSPLRIPRWSSAGLSAATGRQRAINSVLSADDTPPTLMVDNDARGPGFSAGRRLLSTLGRRSAPVVVVEPYLKCSRSREVAGALKLRRIARWGSTPTVAMPGGETDLSRRFSLAADLARGSDQYSLVKRAIALTAPIELVEKHHELNTNCARQHETRTGIIYTANAYQSSPSFRIWAEQCRERGARLVTHQHGGGYGIDRFHFGEEFDVSVSDTFYSWGWDEAEDGTRVRQLPTAWPDRYSGQPSSEYLLMSLPVTTHMYRLQSFLLPSHVSEAIDQTVTMIRGLAASTRLRVRIHQGDQFPLGRVQDCRATLLTDDLDESGTVAASRARLVIHNYLSTAWLETLAMNVPTICFFNPEMYAPREAARPYVDALARVGVIHHSGADAAKFVNQLNGNPDAWWNSSEVQEARQAFVARYANFSDDWLQAWSEEFERLLAE